MQIIDISKGIQVGGYRYRVRVDEEAHNRLEGTHEYGVCCYHSQEILLDSTLKPERISETALHEFLEAVNVVFCAGELEHSKLLQLGYGLHQVLESLGVRLGIEKAGEK